MESEEYLVKRTLKGDQEAFRQIVEKYKSLVYGICYNILQNHNDAENISQETFVQAYRSLDRYELKGFKTWIGRIATNKAIDLKRKIIRERQEVVVYLDNNSNLKAVENTEEIVIKSEERKAVINLCNGLPQIYSSVLQKFYIQSKNYEQIAQEEGISTKTVESRLYRARKMLKKNWEEGSYNETLGTN